MKRVLILSSMIFIWGCQTTQEQAPELSEKMSTKDLIEHAIMWGSHTLVQAKDIILRDSTKKQQAVDLLKEGLAKVEGKYNDAQSVRFFHLYQSFHKEIDPASLKVFLQSKRGIIRAAGWTLAASYPSRSVREVIESVLSDAVVKNTEQDHYSEEMAIAVRQNNIQGVYTIVRQALFATGEEEFAKTMSYLNPKQASKDFLSYLALVDVEELRQLNQVTINPYAALVALRHLLVYPVRTSDDDAAILFFYATSRNLAFAELAQNVIQMMSVEQKGELAFLLAKMPDWVQVALIEQFRRAPSTIKSGLISELIQMTPHKHVQDEGKDALAQ
jgi:hypothetical protein